MTPAAVRLAFIPDICAQPHPPVCGLTGSPRRRFAPGVYRVGPIKFDAKGIWTVRLSPLRGVRTDSFSDDSPHGHRRGFGVQVP